MAGKQAERILEGALFASRWLLAPLYLGLIAALIGVVWVFFAELLHEIAHLPSMTAEQVILMALSLIDLSLSGNLLLIVILSGYENFISRIDSAAHEDRPSWMGSIDFSGLKMKLIASIVAISAIALLRAFMEMDQGFDAQKLGWMVGIHLTFVISGVLLALMDWIAARSEHGGAHQP